MFRQHSARHQLIFWVQNWNFLFQLAKTFVSIRFSYNPYRPYGCSLFWFEIVGRQREGRKVRVTYQLFKYGKNRGLVNRSSTRPFTEFKCKSLSPVDINCFLKQWNWKFIWLPFYADNAVKQGINTKKQQKRSLRREGEVSVFVQNKWTIFIIYLDRHSIFISIK